MLLLSVAGVEIAFARPGHDCLAAGLLVRAKFEEIAVNGHARLLEEFALGRFKQILALVREALRDRPRA